MAATAVVLKFEDYRLHAFERHGSKLPWFVLAEVCDVLELKGRFAAKDAAERLDDDEKGRVTIPTPGGSQQMLAVSLSGLTRLAGTSRKPIAQRFNKWLHSDVVVSIFLTGEFQGDSSPLHDLVGSFQPLLDLSEPTSRSAAVVQLPTARVRPERDDTNQRHLDCISELGESPDFDADVFEPAPLFRDLGDYMDADAPLPPRIEEEWQHQHEGKTYLMSLRSIAGTGTPLRVRIVLAERIPGIEREMLAPIFLPPNEAGERLLVRFEADTPRAVIDAALIYVNPEICWRSKETLDALLA